jgi:hypothetical protein
MGGHQNRYLKWSLVLIALSAATYGLHFAIFRDFHHLAIFLLEDLAFVFLEVLLVTLTIHRLIDSEERRNRLEKLNMVIGAFFSEVGNNFLRICVSNDPNINQIQSQLIFQGNISAEELKALSEKMKHFKPSIDIKELDLHDLRRFLIDNRKFQLRLVENPVLLEHEHFSELLRSVYHVTEELIARIELKNMPYEDEAHIKTDIERAYRLLIKEWFFYIIHLRNEYPYLFSFSTRMNPFNPNASAIINISNCNDC